jgi:chromosome segregation ATPase
MPITVTGLKAALSSAEQAKLAALSGDALTKAEAAIEKAVDEFNEAESLRGAKAAIETQLTAAQAAITAANSSHADLLALYQTALTDIGTLQSANSDLSAQVTSLGGQLTDEQTQRAAEAAQATADLAAKQAELDTMTGNYDTASAQLAGALAALDAIADNLDNDDADNAAASGN